MIGYTCKYTPVELLAALGGQPALLNREAAAFSHAEALTHNHLCCHAKAVLEECRRDGVRELVLVNCCDSIRRCYDVLRAQGGLDFLFLLDLPHHDDGCAKARLRGELERLAAEYGAYRGATLDEAALRAAFAPPVPLPDGPFLAVTGARAGAGLLEALRRVSPLPVADLTCGGNRSLPPPPEGLDGLDGLLDWYTGALLGQIPCLRMDAVGRREELLNHPGLKGLVYHTVKFCDFYSFEYENLRRRTALPLLKVETDFTPLSSGQLSTRLEAFLEGLELRPAPASAARRGAYVAGIDSGSTTTNVVVLDRAGNVAASAIVRTGPKASQGAEKAFAALGGFTPEDMAAIVATGYGRNNIPFATGQVTEITCHARGAHRLYPEARAIVDIGGQDSKVICLDESGGVTNFVMNDKCAAGTGRFLELMARTLELNLDEMARVGLHWEQELTISSMCTVFAESEVVSLIADNHSAADIVHGLNQSVAAKTAALASRAGAKGPYMMTGGVARNRGVTEALEARQSAGPTPPETLLRSQNDQEETLRTLGEELASLRGTMGAFSPLLAQLRHQLRTAEADQARQDGLLRDTVQQTQALEKEIAQREAKVETLEAARRALSVQLEQSTGQKLALERARVENDRAARAQNDLQLRLQREAGVLEQRKLQAGMEEKRLLDRLWDTYGMTHQGALAVRVPVEDAAQAQRRTVQLNQAIQALGTVNLGAVEEFQRVEERYGYLKDQKNDVETAQRELEGVIQEITQEMEAIFRREFARIQAAFSQTFADLFGGGQGTLSLEDETDVLRCGIEIRAQPPGKTLRAISLLSGGERSLVAIALYFAILKIHPTPFCVVDEIEAALDEANGARFIRYLRAVASETQFLLITHRRETMEAADVLYGVTMERQGVSRVLKLDLHQAEALLDGAPA